jgi:hypothetical protein
MEDYEDERIDSNEEKFVIENGVPRKIKSQATTPTIQSIYQDWKDGDLIISPSFQRNYVWNNKKASNLIESILLNIPLPIIFTASVEGKEEVIDGQQRLTAIFSFIDGHFPDGTKFKLTKNLKILGEEIGGKSFAHLEKHYQTTFKKYPLFLVSISEDSQEEVKFEMFERLNTNITSLNAQELRNCLYRGAYNNLLKIMAKDKDFQYILDKPTYKKRMQDVELALMFCAFHNTSPDHYKKSLSQFLNDEMRNHRILTSEKMELLEKQFKKSVRLIKHIWGNRAFNIYSLDEKTKKLTLSPNFNQGLFQILMYWFIPYETNQVIPYADLIKEELINLQIHDDTFRDTLTGSGTNSPNKIRLKFDMWGNTIKGILNYPKNEPRVFSYFLKEQLWKEDNVCQICSQKISTIDDAEIDHITCYWKGGKTIPENARLTHRFCNRSKGGHR